MTKVAVQDAPVSVLLDLIRSGQVEAGDVVRITNERPDVRAAMLEKG